MTNKEMKEYLKSIRDADSQDATTVDREHAIGCEPEGNCECEP
jgi:hypothetical protein